jgi:hypothetical protein
LPCAGRGRGRLAPAQVARDRVLVDPQPVHDDDQHAAVRLTGGEESQHRLPIVSEG